MLLVTGASGYLGSELMRRRPGAVGTHLTRPAPGFALDVRDAAAVLAAFERERPTAVIHTAYRQHDRATTLDGARAVAVAAAAVDARLVHISTDVVFDGEKQSPYREEDEPRPITDYGRAKADAEREVAAVHPAALIVRTSLLYGARGRGRRSAWQPIRRRFCSPMRSARRSTWKTSRARCSSSPAWSCRACFTWPGRTASADWSSPS